MRTLISYDIADDKRRYRVVKRLKRCAVRLQFSVFEGEFEEGARERLWRDLQKLIKPEEDGLLMLGVCEGCEGGRREAGTTGWRRVEDEVL